MSQKCQTNRDLQTEILIQRDRNGTNNEKNTKVKRFRYAVFIFCLHLYFIMLICADNK